MSCGYVTLLCIMYLLSLKVSTPLELPAATVPPKPVPVPPKPVPVSLTPPTPATKGPDVVPGLSFAGGPLTATPPPVARAPASLPIVDDADDELDRLLGLDNPEPDPPESRPAQEMDTHVVPPQQGGSFLYAPSSSHITPDLLSDRSMCLAEFDSTVTLLSIRAERYGKTIILRYHSLLVICNFHSLKNKNLTFVGV